jgi:hypothetical protein
MNKQQITDIIEDCVLIRMKDIPEYMAKTPVGRPVLAAPICPDDGKAALSAKICPGVQPNPRPFDPARLFSDGKTPEWYVSAYLDIFGAKIGRPVIFNDVNGEKLLISEDLFIDRAKSAKAGKAIYKVMERGRHIYLPMLAETIISPQEKWDAWEWVGARDEMVRRVRYLAWWYLDDKNKVGLSVFELAQKKWWNGVTTFAPDDAHGSLATYIESQRHGIRRWPK